LSSPRYAHEQIDGRDASNEEMAACIELLYGGADHAGANVMTVHKMRDSRSKWADPFSYNPYSLGLPLIDNEPFGDGASAGGDTSDPALIAADYQRTCDAGWLLYVAHPASWCIWNKRLPPEYPLRQYAFLSEVPHITETCRLLREIRGDGGGEPEMPVRPYPDEHEIHQLGRAIEDAYQDAGAPFNAEAGVWFTRTTDDYYRGTEPLAVYAAARVKELRLALGL
jgi:hypothetical protein